jgi:hypothetical protein
MPVIHFPTALTAVMRRSSGDMPAARGTPYPNSPAAILLGPAEAGYFETPSRMPGALQELNGKGLVPGLLHDASPVAGMRRSVRGAFCRMDAAAAGSD